MKREFQKIKTEKSIQFGDKEEDMRRRIQEGIFQNQYWFSGIYNCNG